MENLVSLAVGIVLGAVASWLISRHYYRRGLADARDAAIAQRLDNCNEGDKTFLIALLQTKQPIPRYALVNVDFERVDGTKDRWASNTSIMIDSVRARAIHSLQCHSGSNIDEDRQTISLTERGRENADYLLRREYRSAHFTSIDDNDAQRIAMFRAKHGREPTKGHVDDSGVVSRNTFGL